MILIGSVKTSLASFSILFLKKVIIRFKPTKTHFNYIPLLFKNRIPKSDLKIFHPIDNFLRKSGGSVKHDKRKAGKKRTNIIKSNNKPAITNGLNITATNAF